MFEKVETKEIKAIRKRLESELEDENLPYQRRKEVKSFIYHIDTWLDWRDYQERENYREQLKAKVKKGGSNNGLVSSYRSCGCGSRNNLFFVQEKEKMNK